MGFAGKVGATLALVVAAAGSGAAQVVTTDPAGPFVGEWATRFGTLTLEADGPDALRGRYGEDGRLEGEVVDGVFRGYWVEDDSERPQPTRRDGSRHWGRVRFTVDGGSLAGAWSYGEAPPSRPWDGSYRDEAAVLRAVRAAGPEWRRALGIELGRRDGRVHSVRLYTGALRLIAESRHAHDEAGGRRVETVVIEQLTVSHVWGHYDYVVVQPDDARLRRFEARLQAGALRSLRRRLAATQDPSLAKEIVKAYFPYLGALWDGRDLAGLLGAVDGLIERVAEVRAEVRELRERRDEPQARRWVPYSRGWPVDPEWEVVATIEREEPCAVRVTARGSAHEGWPVLRVEADGERLGEATVDHSERRAYDFPLEGARPDELRVVYPNDRYDGPGRDRNLYVRAVRVCGRPLSIGEARYERGDHPAIDGRSAMLWRGALVFELADADGGGEPDRFARRLDGDLGDAIRDLVAVEDGVDPRGRPLYRPLAEPTDVDALWALVDRLRGR